MYQNKYLTDTYVVCFFFDAIVGNMYIVSFIVDVLYFLGLMCVVNIMGFYYFPLFVVDWFT